MKHCFHATGLRLLTDPPMSKVVCCFCGRTAHEQSEYRPESGHGPYAPRKVVTKMAEHITNEECPKREEK